jgi:hypothetical protein
VDLMPAFCVVEAEDFAHFGDGGDAVAGGSCEIGWC